jgi:hypothetical protein
VNSASVIATPWELSSVRLGAFGIAVGLICLGLLALGFLANDQPNAVSKRLFLARLISGADGRLSTSKFQAVLWTLVAVFAFLEVFAERLLLGMTVADSTIPTNMLIAMGLTAATMTAAKGITVSYVGNGLVNKSAPTRMQLDDGRPKFGGLVTDDDGAPDLSKLQMLAFTTIAVIVYILRMALPEKATPELADIEPALMVLMGLSQGAYIGKKLTTTDTPRITGISPAIGKVGEKITLTGICFGDEQQGNTVHVDGTPIPASLSWSDKKIEFKLPPERAPGMPWSDGDRATVVVVANGRESAAPVQLVFKRG